MAKAKATATAVEVASNEAKVKIRPVRKMKVTMRLVGISPLVTHKWSEKAKDMMRDKHAGKKSKNRDIRDPLAEGKAAAYFDDNAQYGVPAMAIKSAIIDAAHKDLGVEKTLVRKALFIQCDDSHKILPMVDFSEPEIREDVVRVGMGSTDLRYRPYFAEWAVDVEFEMDADLLTVDDLINLADRAGFGVGIGEMRPEKGGDFGRFEVDKPSIHFEEL